MGGPPRGLHTGMLVHGKFHIVRSINVVSLETNILVLHVLNLEDEPCNLSSKGSSALKGLKNPLIL